MSSGKVLDGHAIVLVTGQSSQRAVHKLIGLAKWPDKSFGGFDLTGFNQSVNPTRGRQDEAYRNTSSPSHRRIDKRRAVGTYFTPFRVLPEIPGCSS